MGVFFRVKFFYFYLIIKVDYSKIEYYFTYK